ncbi:putative glycosyl hydrolase [Phytophthora cinnamomi]|uniref:putative glycosyl hydrolase n=1 Tax=Phytophthora cinnamomi TaxID=4785 RepID=UPI00355A23FB|nr:putative glycosyl hydrolase [Phytophthora cinnamomi]
MQPRLVPALAAAALIGAASSRADATATSYALGPFTVAVDTDESSLNIVNSAGDQVWKSASDRAFISASSGLTTITQASGNFQLSSSDVRTPCQTATISSTSSSSDSVEVTGSFADASCSGWTWTLSFALDASYADSSDDSQPLVFNASVAGDNVGNVYLAYESPQDEAFFGLGEQTGIGNLRGWRVPVWSREGGVGRGEEPVTTYLNANASISGAFAGGSLLTTYTAVGSLTTSLGRWFVLDGTKYALIDLASNATSAFEDTAAGYLAGNITEGDHVTGSTATLEIMYESTSVSGWIGRAAKGNPLLEASNALTKVSGRQPKLPDWAHDGAILGIQGGQDFVEEVIQNALASNMPLVSVWLQDWSGTRLQTGAYGISLHRLWWNWEPDSTLYPTWAEWVPHLQSTYGVRTMSYINTFLANVSTKSTGYNTSFYSIAVSEGRFVANATAGDGSAWTITSGPGIDAGLLDLSNQSTIDWFKALVKKQYFSVPISGMMQDFGEYLSVDASVSLSSGTVSPRVFHNDYPTVWATLLREVVSELGLENDTIGFHRSAGTFSAKHTNLFWVGDQNIDVSREDGMRAVVSSALHVGASGFGQTHSDIGGYTNTLATVGNITRNAALLGRWGELGAFSGTAFRTHEGNIPQMNVQAYTNETTRAYHAYNARLFRALKSYRLALLEEYQASGWPIVRHPIVYSPNDSVARSVIDETFWLGEALYVAPVYVLSASSVEVYLPPVQVDSQGSAVNASAFTYKHLWSGDEFAPGQTVTVDAPWGKPGVFMRWPVTEQEGLLLQPLWEFVVAENATTLEA